MNTKLLLAASAALSLAACGETAEETDIATDDTAVEQDAFADVSADPAMPTDAQEFVAMQAASDAYEIEAGRMAQENASDDAVKDFGAMMVKDHTTATENLKAAVQQLDGVTVNPQMTAKNRADLDALRDAGDNFDQVYLEQQAAAHEKALNMLRNFAESGDTPALQQFASQTAGVVEGHLEEVRQLQQ